MTCFKRHALFAVAGGSCALLCMPAAHAVTHVFFNASQTMAVVSSNMTDVTILSSGYLFTYSQDGYFTGGLGGGPIGRFFSALWPDGVQAQACTEGPLIGTGANIAIKRADGQLFDLQSFTGRILLNTAGAGGMFEIMPQLNGSDAFNNPLQYDCTGYAGWSFPYTTALVGYDTYAIHMWGDFALTQLTLEDASLPPVLQLSLTSSNDVRLQWPSNADGYTLEQNSSLNPTNWVAVTNSLTVVGTNSQVTLPKQNAKEFFRLFLP